MPIWRCILEMSEPGIDEGRTTKEITRFVETNKNSKIGINLNSEENFKFRVHEELAICMKL